MIRLSRKLLLLSLMFCISLPLSGKQFKRRSEVINIDSPITAQLTVTHRHHSLIATLIFTNISQQDVIVDRYSLGGDNLNRLVFHLNPWYTSPNLTFKSQFLSLQPDYITLRPKETIHTETVLTDYYDFNEKQYDILTITYQNRLAYLDKYYQQIVKQDSDGIIKPVTFSIISNKIKLNYHREIKPILE